MAGASLRSFGWGLIRKAGTLQIIWTSYVLWGLALCIYGNQLKDLWKAVSSTSGVGAEVSGRAVGKEKDMRCVRVIACATYRH